MKLLLTSVVVLFLDVARCQSVSPGGNQTSYTVIPEHPNTNRPCRLLPKDGAIAQKVTAALDGSIKLVWFDFTIEGNNGVLNKTIVGDLFLPFNWSLTPGEAGRELLMLKDCFNAMSLYTLGFGICRFHVDLIQEPANCLVNGSVSNAQNNLRHLLLGNFNENLTGSVFPEETHVCNRHVTGQPGHAADFFHVCCHGNTTDNIQCEELKEDAWTGALFLVITGLKVVFVLYSPLLVPATFYRKKSVYDTFTFNSGSETKIRMKKLESNPDVSLEKVTLHSLSHMTKLSDALKDMEPGFIYEMTLNSIDLSVKASRILPETYAPVGLFSFLGRFFFKCKLREDIASLTDCCNENMLKMCRGRMLRWYMALTFVMTFILSLVLMLPWALRVWFYYGLELDILQHQEAAVSARGMTMPYTGSFTTDLSPQHVIFIVIYVLIPSEVILFFVMTKRAKRKIKFTLRECFRLMKETDRLAVVGEFVAVLLWPLQRYGIVGLVIMPLWLLLLPLYTCRLAFQVFPIVNVSVRLLVNFFYYTVKAISPSLTTKALPNCCQPLFRRLRKFAHYILVIDKQERNIRGNKLFHAVGQFMCLLLMVVVVFIVVECIFFFLECFIYTVIGIILNPNSTLKYVSLVLLIFVYGSDCFSVVQQRYLTFNKDINAEVKKLVGERLKDVAMQSGDQQSNTAFMINTATAEGVDRIQFCTGTDGNLKWEAPRLLMFLDTADTACISRNFLFKMCKLPYAVCPGPIHLNYLKAAAEFCVILLFLGFVFLVILAFGHANNVSSGNQMLATLAGGFLPLMFRKLLFKSHAVPELDGSDIKWRVTFEHAVSAFTERWLVQDVDVRDVVRIHDDDVGDGHLGGESGPGGAALLDENDVNGDVELEELPLVYKDQPCPQTVNKERPLDLLATPVVTGSRRRKFDYFVPVPRPDSRYTAFTVDETEETKISVL